MIEPALAELVAVVAAKRACELLGKACSTHYRRQRPTLAGPPGGVRTLTDRVKNWRDAKMVRRWVGVGMLEAERSFRRIKGCKDMPLLAAAVRREVAQRIADDQKNSFVTPKAYDQGRLNRCGAVTEFPQRAGHRHRRRGVP